MPVLIVTPGAVPVAVIGSVVGFVSAESTRLAPYSVAERNADAGQHAASNADTDTGADTSSNRRPGAESFAAPHTVAVAGTALTVTALKDDAD